MDSFNEQGTMESRSHNVPEKITRITALHIHQFPNSDIYESKTRKLCGTLKSLRQPPRIISQHLWKVSKVGRIITIRKVEKLLIRTI